jgi:hypothetical protein
VHPVQHKVLAACTCVLMCMQVCEVRGRLLSYWARQVLVEAAAEVFPPCSSSRGPPHVRAALPNQVRGAESVTDYGRDVDNTRSSQLLPPPPHPPPPQFRRLLVKPLVAHPVVTPARALCACDLTSRPVMSCVCLCQLANLLLLSLQMLSMFKLLLIPHIDVGVLLPFGWHSI